MSRLVLLMSRLGCNRNLQKLRLNRWADIRGDEGQGQALALLLGNSGPSIARNVRVLFDPAPPATLDILEILSQGISSLAPGRTMQWMLGAAHNAVDWGAQNRYRVRIDAEGPLAPSKRSST
jgi:hypothetical protein